LEILGYPDPISEPKISGYPDFLDPDPTTLISITIFCLGLILMTNYFLHENNIISSMK